MLDLRNLALNDVKFYADPAPFNSQSPGHDPLPLVSSNAGLVNKGGYYDPIPSDYFFEQRAVGQVAKPSWVDYYNNHYALGPADSFTPLRLKYGAETQASWMPIVIIAVVIIGGILVYKMIKK